MSVTAPSSSNDEFTRLVHHYGGSLCQFTTPSMGIEYRWLCTDVRCNFEGISSLMKAAVPRLFPAYVVDEKGLFGVGSHGFTCLVANAPSATMLVVFDSQTHRGRHSLRFLDAFDLQLLSLNRKALLDYERELNSMAKAINKRTNLFCRWNRNAFATHIVGALRVRSDFMQFGFTCKPNMHIYIHDILMFPAIVRFVVNRSNARLVRANESNLNHHVFEYEDKPHSPNSFVSIHLIHANEACMSSLIALKNGGYVLDPYCVRFCIEPGVTDMDRTIRIRTLIADVCDSHQMYSKDTQTGDAIDRLSHDTGVAMRAMINGDMTEPFFFHRIDKSVTGGSPTQHEHFITPILKCLYGCGAENLNFAPSDDCPPTVFINLADAVAIKAEPNGYSFQLVQPAERSAEFQKLTSEARAVVDFSDAEGIARFIGTAVDAKQAFMDGRTDFFVHSAEKKDFEPADYVPSGIAIKATVSLEFITPVLKYVFGCEDDDMFCSQFEEDRAGEVFLINGVGEIVIQAEGGGYRIAVFTTA